MSATDADSTEPTLATAGDGTSLHVFDVPAFARRGLEVESHLQGLDGRCRRRRRETFDMVQVRLRQWAAAAIGPEDWRDSFRAPIGDLWIAAEAEPPRWSRSPGSPRRRRAIARDVLASVERFNARWIEFVTKLDLSLINRAIDDYNRFYLIEKECVLGSARLAAMHFQPFPFVTRACILAEHPPLPVPALVDR